jgi:hypothetical protein
MLVGPMLVSLNIYRPNDCWQNVSEPKCLKTKCTSANYLKAIMIVGQMPFSKMLFGQIVFAPNACQPTFMSTMPFCQVPFS